MSKQPKRRYEEEEIFTALERFNGTQFPLCIKTLLRYAAYDSKSSCILLDAKTVADMENYIADTGAELIASLDCCNAASYKSQQRFYFLPGHKSAILSIPSQIKNMDSLKKKKSKPLVEFKKLLTSTELKHRLLLKLNENALKLGFKYDAFGEDHLSDVKSMIVDNELTALCNVLCISCHTSVSALYKGSWAISNVLRHIKQHCTKGDAHPSRSNDTITNPNMPPETAVSLSSMGQCNELHFDKVGSSTSNINVELLDKVNSGSVSPSELIEEEAYVEDDGHVTLISEKYKIVQLGNGKTLKMNVKVRSRS